MNHCEPSRLEHDLSPHMYRTGRNYNFWNSGFTARRMNWRRHYFSFERGLGKISKLCVRQGKQPTQVKRAHHGQLGHLNMSYRVLFNSVHTVGWISFRRIISFLFITASKCGCPSIFTVNAIVPIHQTTRASLVSHIGSPVSSGLTGLHLALKIPNHQI